MSSRPLFVAQMQELENDLLAMVSRAESMVAKAVDSIIKLDTELAVQVFENDDEVDRYDAMIEEKCLRLLALQQPMASDLREVSTILKIITDVERIGDLAVDLAKITLKIDREVGDPTIVDLPVISDKARLMLREAVTAFVKRDVTYFNEIAGLEDEVDGYYRHIREQLFDYMRQNPSHAVSAAWLVFAVHHIERIADHAVNIAERVGFMVTGRLGHLKDAPGE